MTAELRSADLEAYLDEALPPDEMARIEQSLRRSPDLLQELAAIHARRGLGVHGLGEIWRAHRLSCPTRRELGNYLLGTLDEAPARYLEFHLREIGCRRCQANLADLESQRSAAPDAAATTRRTRYFQSSAGRLAKKGGRTI